MLECLTTRQQTAEGEKRKHEYDNTVGHNAEKEATHNIDYLIM